MSSIFDKYLDILEVSRNRPSLKYLTELTTSHIINIPFENISKLYNFHFLGLKNIPNIEIYLNGISEYNFGGTCYSNNYYFNLLLNSLGFTSWLCGADMSITDAHIVNLVLLKNQKYLVDVGYGAPFINPMPLGSRTNISICHGNDNYVLSPQDNQGNSKLEHYRKNELYHGYLLKPVNRTLTEFDNVIQDSFKSSSTFLNRITFIKFELNKSISVRNNSFTIVEDGNIKKSILRNKNEIIDKLVSEFNLPQEIVTKSVNSLRGFK